MMSLAGIGIIFTESETYYCIMLLLTQAAKLLRFRNLLERLCHSRRAVCVSALIPPLPHYGAIKMPVLPAHVQFGGSLRRPHWRTPAFFVALVHIFVSFFVCYTLSCRNFTHGFSFVWKSVALEVYAIFVSPMRCAGISRNVCYICSALFFANDLPAILLEQWGD